MQAALSRLERHATLLVLAASVSMTLAVYWEVLGFSYFLDDAFDLTRTEEETFWSLLTQPLPHYVYYRPVPFILWKALYVLTGSYSPVVLHLIPVAAHALSGWLLFLLLRRFTGSLWSVVPALLFLLYPFSYQAIEILGTLVHTLVTVEILATLLLWYDGRMRRSTGRLVAAVALSVVALWTHEYAAAIFPLLAALEGLFWFQRRIGRPTLWLIGPLLAELVYLRLWFTIDKPNYDHITNDDIIHNAGFWLQGFAYPISRQTGWLTELIGGDPLRLVLPFSLLGVLVALGIHAYTRQLRPALAGAIWAGVAFLPAVATLTYEYMQNGPRLLYVVSPGVAAFWGLLAMARFPSERTTRIWRVAMLGLVLVVCLQSVLFIERRITMLEHGTDVAEGIIALGERHAGGRVLLLNVPSWFAPKTQEFPRGHLGVQIEPNYIGLERLIYAGSGERVEVESRSLAPNVSGWLYNFQPHGSPIDHDEIDARLRAGAALAVVDLYHESLEVREPGSMQPGQPAPTATLGQFGDGLLLISVDVTRRGDLVSVTTDWYSRQALGADYWLWVQLRGPDGQVVAERQDYALRGMSPPRLWQPGDLIEDRLVLDLSEVQTPGNLSFWVSLVSTADGSPLPATADGRTAPDGWLHVAAN